jgi:hypothetical protein
VGNFYTNVTTIGPSQDELLVFLRQSRRSAFVSPTIHGLTVIYDQQADEQRVEDLHNVAALVSEKFSCRALSALVHDDDILFIAAYQNGELVTEYQSSAGREIRPLLLCRLFGASKWRAARIWWTLYKPHLLVLFEVLRHHKLVRLLGLSDLAVGMGYDYIEDGELPVDGLGRDVKVRHTKQIG